MYQVYLYIMMGLAVLNVALGIAATRFVYKALAFMLPEADRREAVLSVKRPTSKRVPENYFTQPGIEFANSGIKLAKLQRFAFFGALLFLVLAFFG
ncbi:MAG: hypothetical protein HQ472_09500 [Ignavibacteria bacterium]|nr:hypothetical protein [Ignavibacteria bacterium]